MPLDSGARLGPYEIVGPLGAGGMGEVYRAKDTRLGRDVAVKILPAHLSDNPEVRDRFEREARAISSLNHPNICTLYDIGREGDADYFVMELLDGETLSARLERGPLRLDEALRVAAQIADGLAAAHKQGIVHRDLKPGNVGLTKSGAKILDFGVAKLRDEAVVEMATRTTPLTTAGSMIGTVQYMAPEQLEGRGVDHRADLFAFGALLYEMVTGKRAFEGLSQASVIAAILDKEPRPVSELLPTAPAALDRVVKSCLAKDPEERWQSAGDLARELRWIAGGSGSVTTTSGSAAVPARRSRGHERVAWIVATVGVMVGLIGGGLALRPRPQAPLPPTSRFSIASPDGARIATDAMQIRISPDGRALAFQAYDAAGKRAVWIRPLDSLVPRPLPGTDDGEQPFWSPDSRFVGFFANGKLKKVAIAGGNPDVICDSADGRGASWGRGGDIVFAPSPAGPLFRVSENGGAPKQVTTLDASRHETGHRWPWMLPDGTHFLFVSLPATKGNFDVFVGSIDGKDRTPLAGLTANSTPAYVEPGCLIYLRGSSLVAQRFDPAHLKTIGEPVNLGDGPAPSGWTGAQVATAAMNGILARFGMGLPNSVVQWLDREGKLAAIVPLQAGRYESARVAPDGKRLALVRRSSVSTTDIWLYSPNQPAPSRFTFSSSENVYPIWSPDGGRIAFGSDRSGPQDIYVKPTSGAVEETAVLTGGAMFKQPVSWSADGKSVLFEQPDPLTAWDVYSLPVDGDRKTVPLLRTPLSERQAEVSPNGRWVAYCSDESGNQQLYVTSFPVPGAKHQVSTAGADNTSVRWTRGGKELMWVAGGVAVTAADVATEPTFRAGPPHELFRLRPDNIYFDFAPDGQRVILVAPEGDPKSSSITVDLNWPALLEAK